MELIAIAHPDFRPWLVVEAKKAGFIFHDQAFIPGKGGEYPEELETCKNTKTGLDIFFRPVKISDEPLLKEFIYSLSDRSLHRRFLSFRKDMPHERLQEFVIIDYTKKMTILAVVRQGKKEIIVGVGQYVIIEATHTADVAFMIRDDHPEPGDRDGAPLLPDLSRQKAGAPGLYGGRDFGQRADAPRLREVRRRY